MEHVELGVNVGGAQEDDEKASVVATQGIDVSASEDLDLGLAEIWKCAFDGPMGRTEIGLTFELDGTVLGGWLSLMGKDQPIVAGAATKAGFEATIAVKIALKKGEALVTLPFLAKQFLQFALLPEML